MLRHRRAARMEHMEFTRVPQVKWALGLMSGTSLDGVDAALLRTDGERIFEFGPSGYRAYDAAERATLRAGLDAAEGGDSADLAAAGQVVTAAHAALVAELTARSDCPRPGLIGFHGQTVWHDPARGVTRQIGDGAVLAAAGGVDVIADFRSADVAAGGQGAPFAPFYHFALARWLAEQEGGTAEPLAMLNLGGVANVTWIDAGASGPEAVGALCAFDTGPASALLDDWMMRRTGVARDTDGAAAQAGQVSETALAALTAHPYFDAPPPKSLDRNEFSALTSAVEGLSTEDGAATLTAFSAETIARAVRFLPAPPSRWLAMGGGRRNPTMLAMIADRLAAHGAAAEVAPAEAVGLDGDMIEAQAFAFLAVRSARGMPLSAPGTTGVTSPLTGGRLFAA